MKLSDYIPFVGTDAEVSRRSGLDRTTISRIRRGLIDPPVSTAERIVAATGGAILITPPMAGSRRLTQAARAQ